MEKKENMEKREKGKNTPTKNMSISGICQELLQ